LVTKTLAVNIGNATETKKKGDQTRSKTGRSKQTKGGAFKAGVGKGNRRVGWTLLQLSCRAIAVRTKGGRERILVQNTTWPKSLRRASNRSLMQGTSSGVESKVKEQSVIDSASRRGGGEGDLLTEG